VDITENQTVVSFCTGYGGIERGLAKAGVNCRTIVNVEIEAFAVANLVKEMEAGRMDSAPIFTDVKTFPSKQFRGRICGIVAGYPCQPFSVAGRGDGAADPRHLWPYIYKHIQTINPVWVFLENVRGHVKNGLREVLKDLENGGYRTEWGIFSAAEVGAPHRRARVFVLAYSNGVGLEGFRKKGNTKRRKRPPAGSARLCNGTNKRNTWEVEPRMGRVANGVANRVDRLRLLGNGVVPQQAAKAFLVLNDKLNGGV